MAKVYPIEEVVESLCLRSGDIQMRNKGLYLEVAKDVWEDMNEGTLKIGKRIKIPYRQQFCVDKKTNSINIPEALRISSIHYADQYGCFWPIYRNDTIEDDIVDLGEAERNCACEHKCSSALCNSIKGYEAVVTDKTDYLPNGEAITFSCVDKKIVDAQGFLYEQTEYPLRVYISGVWTDTVKHTETKTLCQVDVDENGCVCDTIENLDRVCNACHISSSACCPTDSDIVYGGNSSMPPTCVPEAQTWMYQCASRMEWWNVQCGGYPYRCGNGFSNIYNINVAGSRVLFPYNFGWDNIMVRFYEDIQLRDIKVPYMAKECFMTGMQYFSVCHHDKKQNLAAVYGDKYSKQKWGLFGDLNKLTQAELKTIFAPQAYWPSYSTYHNTDWYDIGRYR